MAGVEKFHLSEVTSFSLSSKQATMATFLIILFIAISISFCIIAAMDDSLSTSSPSPISPPPFSLPAPEIVFSPHFITPIFSISQILAERGSRDLSMAACALSLSSESHLPWLDRPITILAPSGTSLRTCLLCWLLVLLQKHSIPGVRIAIVGLIFKAADDVISDVSTQVSCWDFDTGLDISFKFILGDITSHMAMKYSVGHTVKEILASSLTINTTMPPNQVVPPSFYWDADHYPP